MNSKNNQQSHKLNENKKMTVSDVGDFLFNRENEIRVEDTIVPRGLNQFQSQTIQKGGSN
jgi:hypothetical protein